MTARGRWGWLGLVMVLLVLLIHGSASAQNISLSPHRTEAGESTGTSTGTTSTTQATGDKPFSFDMWRMFAALAIVLGLVFVARWAVNWMMGSRNLSRHGEAIQVLSRKIIAPKQQMMLVQVGRRVILIGHAGGQMNSLAEFTDPDEVTELIGRLQVDRPDSITRAFGTLFRRAEEKYEPPADLPDAESTDQPSQTDLADARSELSGLMQQVKEISKKYQK